MIVVARDVSTRPFTQADLAILSDFAVQASIALENARLLRLASARAERVKAAAEVGQLLASIRDADGILDLIAEKCREILKAEAFGMFRIDGNRLQYVRGFGLGSRFQSIALGEGVVGCAARDRRTIETSDILRDPEIELSPETRARVESLDLRAVAAVPLLAGSRVLGVLAIYHAVDFRLPAEDREFLETLAAHAALALENARLFGEIRRRQETAEALADITQTLAASLDLRTVLAGVAEGVRALFGADGGAIGLMTRRGTMRVAARVGLGADALRHLVVGPGQGGTGWVLRHGQTFRTSDYGRDPRITQTLIPEIQQAGIRGMLAVPVRLKEEIVGIVYGFWSQPVELSDEHVSLGTDLARMVAVAVANARLYQEARDREAEARALFEVGRLISSTLDPDRVFDRIVERVLELMRVRACGIFRLDPDGLIRYARGAGLSPEFVRDMAVPLGQGPSAQSVAERRPVWAADLMEAEIRVQSSVHARAGRARGIPRRAVRADPDARRAIRMPGHLLVGAARAHRRRGADADVPRDARRRRDRERAALRRDAPPGRAARAAQPRESRGVRLASPGRRPRRDHSGGRDAVRRAARDHLARRRDRTDPACAGPSTEPRKCGSSFPLA